MAAATQADAGLRHRPAATSTLSTATLKPELTPQDITPPAKSKALEDDTTKQAPPAAGVSPSVGRTKDGHTFVVPHTPDMLSSIFDPREPKTPLDFVTIASLSLQIILYFVLPRAAARWFFFIYFGFWRACYDAGLGHILKMQSEHSWITKTVKTKGWFDQKRNAQTYKWVRNHLETKMEKDYNFEACPLEYNIWIFFRSIVDIILLNDFVAYSLFAFSCTRLPEGHSTLLHVLRWVAGWALIFFNLWVKIDAHRVVKDYAWYWGDCFFSITKDLVFDGVYEIAPDPMYSLGYAGYYGLSLVSGSYAVLFVSLAAHFAQYLFMCYFENPHIERTYGEKKPLAARIPLSEAPYNAASASVAAGNHDPVAAPATGMSSGNGSVSGYSPRKYRDNSLSSVGTPSITDATSLTSEDDVFEPASPGTQSEPAIEGLRDRLNMETASRGRKKQKITNLHDLHHKLFRKDTVVYKNLDLLRGTDFLLVVVGFYAVAPQLLPSNLHPNVRLALYCLNALFWRAFHSGGLGMLLRAQSQSKWMVRHYIKHYNYDDPSDAVFEAFASFKTIYNTSLVMVYSSFAILCWHCYAPLGRDWTVGTDLLRHTLGGLLVALHVWAANSSYKVLGPFGWFYGDFFIDEYPHQLYYTGIYRFLNNPERSMGGAGWFGLVLISGSKLALIFAVLSFAAHWVFLSCVENPHMRKLYGEAAVSRQGGVTKQLKNVAKRNARIFDAAKSHPAVAEMRGHLEKVQKDASSAFDDFVRESGSRIEKMREEGKRLLERSTDRLLIVRVGNDTKTIDRSQYSIHIDASLTGPSPRFHLGDAISVNWSAPAGHSKHDWIGLYLVSRFGSTDKEREENRLITRLSSHGSWLHVARDDDENTDGNVADIDSSAPSSSTSRASVPTKGRVTFRGSHLPWVPGVYEARYHHSNKQDVLAWSSSFSLYVSQPADANSFSQIYDCVAQIVVGALESNSLHAPRSQTGRPRAESANGPPPTGRLTDHDADDFTIWEKDQAKRIAKAIKYAFDVDLSSEVVVAEANVRRLAEDVVEAKRLLKPNTGGGSTGPAGSSGELGGVPAPQTPSTTLLSATGTEPSFITSTSPSNEELIRNSTNGSQQQ